MDSIREKLPPAISRIRHFFSKAYCNAYVVTRTVRHFRPNAKYLRLKRAASPPKKIESFQKYYRSVSQAAPNTQRPLPPPGDDITLREKEFIYRFAEYSAITYCDEDSARGMTGVQVPPDLSAPPTIPPATPPVNESIPLKLGNFRVEVWRPLDDLLFYVAVNEEQRTIVLAFEGSANTDNFLRDLNGTYLPPDPTLYPGAPTEGRLHAGFQNATVHLIHNEQGVVQAVNEVISRYEDIPGMQWVITGHSLGAALAANVYIALKINKDLVKWEPRAVYTYSQPIISNRLFADWAATLVGPMTWIPSISSDDMVPYVKDDNDWKGKVADDKVISHSSLVDEVYFPRFDSTEVIYCTGMNDPRCSIQYSCKQRTWLHHSWMGGQWLGRAFCLLSSTPQPMKKEKGEEEDENSVLVPGQMTQEKGGSVIQVDPRPKADPPSSFHRLVKKVSAFMQA
ncbi:Alpha/Beta hydrolase protein [Piptocephalis cylindrospora]|uniref:Alpha/Beta hydrolase protein n=1 Tax=Piptocephalis cylindrospora TaxID=1907219 RepID=A0A4P9Y7D0_9FUNG|nr:Alpha/Beta hydrolase protein [Piptocephalis cylindrospora]|eukprot:RKP14722.1 Alpha/Beta hydrolase protein [Piptocephalis cylindrospora]